MGNMNRELGPNMNIHITLANLRENWAQKKNRGTAMAVPAVPLPPALLQ